MLQCFYCSSVIVYLNSSRLYSQQQRKVCAGEEMSEQEDWRTFCSKSVWKKSRKTRRACKGTEQRDFCSGYRAATSSNCKTLGGIPWSDRGGSNSRIVSALL